MASSKGLFRTGAFKPGLFAPGEFRGAGITQVIPGVPLPGIGGGVSPGFDYEGLLNQFGTPPDIILFPPAPAIVKPVTVEYAGAGAPTVYLNGLGLQGNGAAWLTVNYVGGAGNGNTVLQGGPTTVVYIEGTIGFGNIGVVQSQVPAGTV